MSAHGVARYRRTTPATTATTAPWPPWLPESVRDALVARGIAAPWAHQVQVAEAAHAGWHTIVATATASGKSLSYLLPVLAATYSGPDASAPAGAGSLRDLVVRPTRPHTALYLAPTKSLAHDQARWCAELGIDSWRVAAIDGDCDPSEREWARKHASLVLTNPDMLHHAILAHHGQWASFLRSLRYIVVDECHRYRGLFGAHVATVLRRLRRLCANYGADPVVICASATTLAPEEVAARLIGVEAAEVIAVTADTAPHGCRDVVLWQPTGHHDAATAQWLAEQAQAGRQTIAFVSSRVMAEVVASRAQRQVGNQARVEAYRGGYLAADRRRLEADLQSGALTAVAATNALELGVDISGMDTVIVSGYPGTRAAFWQQAGRAGRDQRRALVVLVARENPLDAYLLDHPEALLDAPVEATVVFSENPFVLGPHLAAAAQELPLTAEDVQWFGPKVPELAARLSAQGMLRERPSPTGPTWFWTHPRRPHESINLRAIGGKAIDIVDQTTGRVLGQVDPQLADRSLHPGAIHLHQGETWLVTDLDEPNAVALVRQVAARYYTQAQSASQMTIVATHQERELGLSTIFHGEVELSTQVNSFLRRDEQTGKVWDSTPLEMPVRTLRTQGTWWTLPNTLAASLPLTARELAGAAHGAEHCAIGLLPLFAPCDRWDIGGVSTPAHSQTGQWTVFIYDGHAGGAGFAAQGFSVAENWWTAIIERLTNCPCESGCPACVVSPKCGSGNQTLDKRAAQLVMSSLGQRNMS